MDKQQHGQRQKGGNSGGGEAIARNGMRSYRGKSLSPKRGRNHRNSNNIPSNHHNAQCPSSGKARRNNHNSNKNKKKNAPRAQATIMTVIINRVDLIDVPESNGHGFEEYQFPPGFTPQLHPIPDIISDIIPYTFHDPAVTEAYSIGDGPETNFWDDFSKNTTEAHPTASHSVSVTRNRHHQTSPVPVTPKNENIPNPFDTVHDKYWEQRYRLFSKFDQGILLDPQGWYSVTPEPIADHVARRVGHISQHYKKNSGGGFILIDAFCGCGGNAIAFGKNPNIAMVVCLEVDREKLRMAARNARIYEIPPEKLLFIECNSLFVLDKCYERGAKVIGTPREEFGKNIEFCEGYTIGGLELLPPKVDAVFMDPPWGGMDYNKSGKNGYDLSKHMKIQYQGTTGLPQRDPAVNTHEAEETWLIDGVELLKMAAKATKDHLVIYDLPRNTNKVSLGRAAIDAGFRGNLKLEEHYLNGRLKTVTGYLGQDFRWVLN